MDTIPAGILIADAEKHEVVYMNPTAGGMIGVDPHKMIGTKCHRVLCPGEEGNYPMDGMDGIDQSQRVMPKADGSKAPVMKTASRTVLAEHECFIDLTNQIRAEKDQARLKAQLRHG